VSSVVVNLRLPPELAEATKAKAEQEERSQSAVIRRALKLHLDDEPVQAGCTCLEPVVAGDEASYCARCNRSIRGHA